MVKSVIELLKEYPLGKTILALPARLDQLEQRVKELEQKLSTPLGDRCEYCGDNQKFLDREEPAKGYPPFIFYKVYRCHTCDKESKILSKP